MQVGLVDDVERPSLALHEEFAEIKSQYAEDHQLQPAEEGDRDYQ
jgi:hypothetical protein